MKFIIFIIVSILLTSGIYGSNKYEKYVTSLLNILGAKPDHITECLDPEWRLDKSQDYIAAETEFNNAKDSFNLLNKGLNKDLDNYCFNKKDILASLHDQYKVEQKSNKKSFLQVSLNTVEPEVKKPKSKAVVPKKKNKFGAFDDYYPNQDKFRQTFKSLFETPMMEKTIKFLNCYKHAKGTPATCINLLLILS
jgi:hypothetical protein